MFKLICFFSLLVFMFSCVNEQTATNYSTVENDSISLNIVASNLDTSFLEKEDEFPFYFLEDYVKLNTRSKLKKAFDSSTLVDTLAFYAEGTVKLKITKLNLRNGNMLRFIWDQKNDEKLSFIEASYYLYSDDYEIIDSQKIASQTGLYLGMPIKELRQWNEANFEFSGFGWDYGGGIMSTQDSKLSKLPFYITLGLTPTKGGFDSELLGDKMFSADDPLVKKSKVYVDQFTIHPAY